MSKSIIRAYTAWWPEEGVTTRQEAKEQSVTEQWTAEYMKGEGFDDSDIEIVENLQPGESHRIHVPTCRLGKGFDVVVEYEGESWEDHPQRTTDKDGSPEWKVDPNSNLHNTYTQ